MAKGNVFADRELFLPEYRLSPHATSFFITYVIKTCNPPPAVNNQVNDVKRFSKSETQSTVGESKRRCFIRLVSIHLI